MKKIKKKNAIIITGGAGYVGSNLILSKRFKKTNLLIIDKNLKKKKYNQKFRFFFKSDFVNYQLLDRLVENFNVTTVIHLAAYTNVSESIRNEKKYFKNNYLKSKQLIDFCKKSKIKKFIFASSAAVYGKVKSQKITEKKRCLPINPYGFYKLQIEKYLRLKKLNHVILRFFNIAGADPKIRSGISSKNNKSLIHIATICAVKKTHLNIYGINFNTKDGSSERDYVHVTDVTNVIIKSISYLNKNKKNLTINCGTQIKTSTLSVINNLNKLLKTKIKIIIKSQKPGEIPSIVCNNKKLRKLLKYRFKYKFKDTLRSSINWINTL